jgi:glyoxylase-like metal-dependent hydrolase (beta-lactamase superfamily II)
MKRSILVITILVSLVTLAACTSEVPVDVEKRPAPVPKVAFGPEIPQDKGYLVEEIRDGLYWVTEGAYQIIFLTTGEGVIVVDAPPTIGQNILKAIGDVTSEPITHIIYSHTHADHIGAASLYPSDAIYITHEDTASQLTARMNDPNRPHPFGMFLGGSTVPLPTVTFSDSFTLNVGNQTLELEYRGANHEPGNIFIYAPKQKVLMLVDVIFPGWVPFKSLALAEDVPGFIQAHDEVLSFDFDTFVGGHLNRLGTRQDVELQKEYILDVQTNAAQALQTVDFFAIAQETGFENPWVLFDRYLDAVTQEATDLTVPKWVGRLGGADIFTYDHCFVMIESLRID